MRDKKLSLIQQNTEYFMKNFEVLNCFECFGGDIIVTDAHMAVPLKYSATLKLEKGLWYIVSEKYRKQKFANNVYFFHKSFTFDKMLNFEEIKNKQLSLMSEALVVFNQSDFQTEAEFWQWKAENIKQDQPQYLNGAGLFFVNEVQSGNFIDSQLSITRRFYRVRGRNNKAIAIRINFIAPPKTKKLII